jgi:hypothetical protein
MSEGTELGKAFVQIVPSAKGIKGATAKLMSGEAKDAGEKSGLSIASGIKKAIAVAGIGMALKKSLDLGGELQQNLGGTEAVFGKHADTLQAKAKEAYKNMGLSASDYMATANKMGSLFQGSGVSQVKSLDMTEKAMQRAADVASVMGLDTSMAMESIAGAAKGNFTMMDNLGVAMNATTLKAYALEQGINFDWNTADNAQKAELAMQMFMDRTSQYEGNFARESEETFSGSIGAMKAAAEDLMGNLMLGQNVDESMGALVESASTFLFQNLIPSVGNIFKSLPSAAATFLKTGIPELVSSGGELINGIVTGAAEKIPELIEKAPEMINQIKEYIATKGPELLAQGQSLISQFGEGIASKGPDLLAKGGEIVVNIANGIWESIPSILSKAGEMLTGLVSYISENLPTFAKKGGEILKNLVTGFIQNLPSIIGAVAKFGLTLVKNILKLAGSLIKSGAELIGSLVKGLGGGALKLVSGAAEKIKGALMKPIEKGKELIKGIVDKIKGFFNFHINLPHVKLPHFSVTPPGWKLSDLLEGKLPKLGISWYKKAMNQPMMFQDATLFGAGEAGDEVIYGRQNLMKDIKEATGERPITNIFNITVDGAEDPVEWTNQFVRQFKMDMRMG